MRIWKFLKKPVKVRVNRYIASTKTEDRAVAIKRDEMTEKLKKELGWK